MVRKMTAALLAAMMVLCMAISPAMAEEKEIHIVGTIFPICDWVREIVGRDNARIKVTQLLDSGVDLHSFQPTAADILNVQNADLFIYVGGESDGWVDDVTRVIVNPDWKSLSLVDAMGDAVKAEEIVEGMEHEHEHEHDDEDHEEHEHEEHEEEEEADEHVWLSLHNAQLLCRSLCDMLCEIDDVHAGEYRKNTEAYLEKLDALDQAYREMTDKAAYHTVLFADRFPFRYLADDYGLTYFAAFSGCSAECEASFQTIAFLAQKLDELGLPAVLTIENANVRIAETVISTSRDQSRPILTMNSMQAATSRDAEAGVTYLSLMEENLKVLEQALN